MKRRLFLLAGIFSVVSAAMPAITDQRPNILVIMSDDMGYSDLGCYGSEIHTPNLDGLAENGLRYSQMYNTSKCTTSRSVLLTGRYVNRSSHIANYDAGPTLGEVAKSAGYRTLWSGKNHSEIRPPERGFDRFYGFQGGACNYWNPGKTTKDGKPIAYARAYEWMVDDQWHKTYIPDDPNYYMTDAITDNALAWLDEYQGNEQPFLLYVAYNAPHWPLHARDEDIATYAGKYDAGYQAIQKARYDRMVSRGLIDPETAPMNPQDLKPWDSLSPENRKLEAQRMEVHAAMVDRMDQNIGRIIAALKERGELDNTLILFFADNGADAGGATAYKKNYTSTGLEKRASVFTFETVGRNWAQVLNCPLARHKRTSHEGGVCTPMVAHWPNGIKQRGGWCSQTAHLVDIMSTVLELTGESYPDTFNGKPAKPVEGVSLVPSFKQQPLGKREHMMGYDFGEGQGLRDGQWKLVAYRKGPWELYDMSTDRTETRNLADQMPEKVKEMKQAFIRWEKDCREGL